ncbi:BAG domain-containing protein [Mariannaea sp. PMI_226]|nr:BAG domain-containing protein [Mariannaea sp. PMI_226]
MSSLNRRNTPVAPILHLTLFPNPAANSVRSTSAHVRRCCCLASLQSLLDRIQDPICPAPWLHTVSPSLARSLARSPLTLFGPATTLRRTAFPSPPFLPPPSIDPGPDFPPLPSTSKVDSSQEIVASPGALKNVATYLNVAFTNLSTVIHGSNGFIADNLGLDPNIVYYSGLAAVLLALPLTMSRRYGWSLGRQPLSPYSSMSGPPAITDEDFSYITSQDLDTAPDHYYPPSRTAAPPDPEDDIILIKHKGVTYPAHFPAYSIGDGKLQVADVKQRAALMMDLPSRVALRMKLIYKGRQLKDHEAPIREYGVKNNSELMAVISEIEEASSPSSEEMVIVDAPKEESKSKTKKSKKKKSGKKKGDTGSSITSSSPRTSTSTLASPKSPVDPSTLTGPMKVLYDLGTEFTTKWLPLCEQYIAAPPSEAKKREEEHRKLSETIMQQIVLKLDSVESEGIAEVRARRKELVKHVQDTLKRLDAAKDS